LHCLNSVNVYMQERSVPLSPLSIAFAPDYVVVDCAFASHMK
jgi:hypothetical protein